MKKKILRIALLIKLFIIHQGVNGQSEVCIPILTNSETNFEYKNNMATSEWRWRSNSEVRIVDSEEVNTISPNGGKMIRIPSNVDFSYKLLRENVLQKGIVVNVEDQSISPTLRFPLSNLPTGIYVVEYFLFITKGPDITTTEQVLTRSRSQVAQLVINGVDAEIVNVEDKNWVKGITTFEIKPGNLNYTLEFGAKALIGRPYLLLDGVYVYNKDQPCEVDPCQEYSSFHPEAGKYVLSAWVKEAHTGSPSTYNNSSIAVNIDGNITIAKPSGAIIDGWQKIDQVVNIPKNALNLEVSLENNHDSDVYFDDIRFHPFDANMKSFVYDPITQRLMAELDENNYATFYEYDSEGGLVRVKKETERGIQTIQETRSATATRNNTSN